MPSILLKFLLGIPFIFQREGLVSFYTLHISSHILSSLWTLSLNRIFHFDRTQVFYLLYCAFWILLKSLPIPRSWVYFPTLYFIYSLLFIFRCLILLELKFYKAFMYKFCLIFFKKSFPTLYTSQFILVLWFVYGTIFIVY